MTYDQTLAFLYARRASVYRGLHRIRYVLRQLGNPHEAFPSVLITGTNGKGSTAKILSTVLRQAGYRVGCFTSPHLVDFCERITINGAKIARSDVVAGVELIQQKALTRFAREQETLGIEGQVSFFEIVTALALWYFAQKKVSTAVLEVGIGGRLDATNTVNPLISVITNVGLDHQHYLGDTVAAIAREKAAIIRPSGDVVTGALHPEALEVITAACDQQQARLRQTAVLADPASSGSPPPPIHVIPQSITAAGAEFTYQGLHTRFEHLRLPLPGQYQLANAAIALAALELLEQYGFQVTEAAVRDGLAQVTHPGRLEIVHTTPRFLVDIAHNPMGAQALTRALTALFTYSKLIVVIGILQDRDIAGIVRPFVALADVLIFTSPRSTDRAASAATTAEIANRLDSPRRPGAQWLTVEPVEAALHAAHALAGPDDLVCITGSTYTVADAAAVYQQDRGCAAKC
jgi:dihydrofolate synthase / folylpolyglutamate synthase